MDYSEQLKDKRWLKKRVSILKRDKHKCVLCGYFGSKVNVHHLKYTGMAWDAPDEDLITLCSECHRTVHLPEIGDNRYNNMQVYKFLKSLLSNG